MAQRGRKPKPTALKVLEGNPGKRPLNVNEPKPINKAPACPKWLDDDAKKEWRRLSKQLESLGVLTELDMAAFAAYCQSYSRWKSAEEFITKHGMIYKTSNGSWASVPQASESHKYFKDMARLCEQFGLTPSSRSRVISGSNDATDDDMMEYLLSGHDL